MTRPLAAVIALLALAACKDKKQTPAAAAPPDDAAAAAPADAGRTSDKPLLEPAPPPGPSTADACKITAEYATVTLRKAAEARKVPADKLDGAAKELSAAFLEMCGADAWPAYFVECIGKSTQDVDTYRRCFDRLSAPRRAAWNARLETIIGAAGGTIYPPPPQAEVEGTTFEELCPVFVAESGRLDVCAGAGMYIPQLEEVFATARRAEVGGLIPVDAQPAIKAMCDERAQVAREAASNFCRGQPPAQ